MDRPRWQMRDERGGGGLETVAALAEVVGVRRVDRGSRQAQPALHAAQQLAARQGEVRRGGQRVHQGEQRCEVARLGGAYGVGKPVPQGHGVALDQARPALGGADGRDTGRGEPVGEGHLPLGPLAQLGVAGGVPAHLEHQVADGEHRVLAQREQFRRAGETGGRQHLARSHLVHGCDFASPQATLTNR